VAADHADCATDPQNLIWVMPAEGDLENSGPAVVLAGGEAPSRSTLDHLPTGALVIAADSGVDSARKLGVPVHLVVGDFDSATPAGLGWARASGARLERHPADKDATDLELALDAALRLNRSPVLVVGGAGGERLDHLAANVALLAAPRYAPLRLRWLLADGEVAPVHDRLEIQGSPEELVTLLAVGGPATGVTTSGLRWPLVRETLQPGSTRGVSNRLVGATASISLEDGVVLAFHLWRT
jgi:thiamine pyrophosphokinase